MNCDINNNRFTSVEGGGILIDESTVTLDKCTINNNYSSKSGGGIAMWKNSNLYLFHSKVIDNVAYNNYQSMGGGIYIKNGVTTLTIKNTTIESNLALFGAGIYIYKGTSKYYTIYLCIL